MGILLTIIIGFVAGIIAKFLYPGPNEPQGFILTTILGIWAHLQRRSSARPWVGIRPMRVPG